ncbi:alpha/beta hydrolase [bacterium]|nr:alpha/beta hydrolase [bacterium]
MRFWVFCLALTASLAAEPRELIYAQPEGQELRLDLDLPEEGDGPFPLVMMIHGGSWSSGSRTNFFSPELVEQGFAVASIDYRLAPDSKFPAFIQDVKSAIRFLRAHSGEYRLDPARFGLWGSSAGGHLAVLAALAGPSAGWDVGDNLNVSSEVQAVVDWFGPTTFQGLENASESARETVHRAFGGDSLIWRQASPLFLVHRGAPPFLIMHGRQDRLVPFSQSQSLFDSLRQAEVSAQLVPVSHAGHDFKPVEGNPEPSPPKLRQQVFDFFRRTLKS